MGQLESLRYGGPRAAWCSYYGRKECVPALIAPRPPLRRHRGLAPLVHMVWLRTVLAPPPVPCAPLVPPAPSRTLEKQRFISANFRLLLHRADPPNTSEIFHEPEHHLCPPLELWHGHNVRSLILAQGSDNLVMGLVSFFLHACAATRKVGDHW